MPTAGIAGEGAWSLDHQRRDRRIVPHRERGLFAGAEHRQHEILALIGVSTKGHQESSEAIGLDRQPRIRIGTCGNDALLGDRYPLAAAPELALEFVVRVNAALIE